MVRISFVTPSGETTSVEVETGISVMEAATRNDIEGIIGDCGGACSCATCHVYVDENWADGTGAVSFVEEPMLDFVAAERKPTSRLCCQIQVTEALDGLRIHIPENQH